MTANRNEWPPYFTEAEMAAIESGAGDAGAWVQTAEEVYAEHQAENLAAADLESA